MRAVQKKMKKTQEKMVVVDILAVLGNIVEATAPVISGVTRESVASTETLSC